jgi:hypothetical protein
VSIHLRARVADHEQERSGASREESGAPETPVAQRADAEADRPVLSHHDRVVQRAMHNRMRHLAALSAADIVGMLLYPQTQDAWAAAEHRNAAQLSNLLRGFKAYITSRDGRPSLVAALADRLSFEVGIVQYLIAARPARPETERPPWLAALRAEAGLPRFGTAPPIDWMRPPYPTHRDGTSPIEQAALQNYARWVCTMSPETIVTHAIWPDRLSALARRLGRKLGTVENALRPARALRPVVQAVSARVGVTTDEFTAFCRAARATEPSAAVDLSLFAQAA